MKIKVPITIVVLFFMGCSNKEETNQKNITVVLNVHDPESFVEKDFFEMFSIDTLINLELKDDFYMADLYRIKMGRNEYYALDPLMGNLIRYSRDGKVLNRIGVLGPGPMEMPEIDDFAYDNDREELLLGSSTARKISRFKPDGTFISSIRLGEQLDQFSYNENTIAVSLTYFNSLYKNFALLNTQGDTIRTFFPYPKDVFPILLKFVSGHVTNSIYGGFLFNEPASSKIYFFNSAGEFYPKYEFVGGDDFWPTRDKDLINDFFQTLSKGELSYVTRYYEESENYFFFNVNFKKANARPKVVDPRIGYYDFEKKIAYYSKFFDGLSWIKGPMEVEGDMFYCWIAKAKINILEEKYSAWRDILINYPELKLDDPSDNDTPVLLRLKIRE